MTATTRALTVSALAKPMDKTSEWDTTSSCSLIDGAEGPACMNEDRFPLRGTCLPSPGFFLP